MEKKRILFWRDNGYVFWWFIHLRLLLPPSSDCIHFGRYVFSQNATREMGLSVSYVFNTDYTAISFQIEYRPVFTSRWTIRHLSSTVWKRPVFQSWAYWCLASKCTEFSFRRRVDNKGHFIWARFPRSRLTSKSFVKFFLCSYERAGWLGSRDLGFSNQDLGKRAWNVAIWTLQPCYRVASHAGVFSGEGRNTSSPKNTCVGG